MKNIFQPVTLIRDIEDQTVLTEEDAIFECEIKINYPEIRLTWYKGTERILSNKKYEIKIEGDRHILKIRNCQLGDQANYRVVCGPHIASAKLHVIGKCRIGATFSSIKYLKLSDVVLGWYFLKHAFLTC